MKDSENPDSKSDLWWWALIGSMILGCVVLRFEGYKAELSNRLNKGDIVEIRFENYSSASLETHKACVKAVYWKNDAVIKKMIAQKQVFPLSVGTKAKVIEVGTGWCRLVLLDGKYNKVFCYYPIEWIRKR